MICNENKVKLINTGVKTFVRCDNKNLKFRLAQEGVQSIAQYISDQRKLHISKEDLIMLLQNNDPHAPPEIAKLSLETQRRLKDFGKCSNNVFTFFYIIHKYCLKNIFNLSDGKLYTVIQRREN